MNPLPPESNAPNTLAGRVTTRAEALRSCDDAARMFDDPLAVAPQRFAGRCERARNVRR